MIKDSRLKGAITEKKVALKFLENGFNLYEPVIPGEEIDLVVEKNNKFFRIQIKTAYYVEESKSYRATLSGSNHRVYGEDAFDYFAIYLSDKDDVYIVPRHKANMKSINIVAREFSKFDKSKNNKTFYPKDYLNNFNLL